MKTLELKVYAYARGIKKRCRKVSTETIKLGNHPLDADRDALKSQAIDKILEIMKSCSGATIHFIHVEIEQCDGYAMENAFLYDNRNTKEVLIENSLV